MSRHLQRSHGGYTLTHAGHQIRIGPVAFWIVVGALVIMGVWSIATGSYFAFRENVLTRLIGRQAEMQFAYEDRIAELRAQVDRIMSRQLLDQEQFEQKLNSLLQRQAILEQRTTALGGETLTTGSVKPSRVAPPGAAERIPRPSPISDTVIFTAPPDREARLYSRELPAAATQIAERSTSGGLTGVLARISTSLDKVEQKQAATLSTLEERIDTKARRMRGVLADLGVEPVKSRG
ncbi:MAG TPA: M23 family peptidase, partial [Pseudolabrys sp.]|nr:M23 family peptidase [Pseudolabrys sp.]